MRSRQTSRPELDAPHIPGLTLQDKVGEGGMSVVYRALNQNLHRTVAVKLLRDLDEESSAWLRESRLMAAMEHPNVVRIYDAGQSDGQSYLILEYMAGGSLRDRMTPGRPWPLPQTLPLLECVAQALTHIHRHGVLHLDLKPENILYTTDDQVKIADFGLSVPHSDAHALLEGRCFKGTLDYCAPEYRTRLALDQRFDVFSLATVAYELLTGKLPGRVYRPASERNPKLPKAIDPVLERGLARDPSKRYSSVSEFQRALASAADSGKRRPYAVVVYVSLAIAALGVVALAAFLQKESPKPTAKQNPPPVAVQALEETQQRWAIYDEPGDLAWFSGLRESQHPLRLISVKHFDGDAPSDLPLPVWPTPRPVLILRTSETLGFVYPFADPKFSDRIAGRWSELLAYTVPPKENLAACGRFDGECSVGQGGDWVIPHGDWNAKHEIKIDRPPGQPDNPALLLTNLETNAEGKSLIGCYQPLPKAIPPDSVVVLRYRARSLNGKGSLSVHATMPLIVPKQVQEPLTARLGQLATPIQGAPGHWLFLCPTWVVPSVRWRQYVVVWENPPFPTRLSRRNLVVYAGATHPSAVDQIWVDDVELFVWHPGAKQ